MQNDSAPSALRKITDLLGPKIQVVEIDASNQPEVARQWGVLSVPTTFVIDKKGKARFVNHGVTRADKLLHQIGQLEI